MKKVKLGNTGYAISPVVFAGIVSMNETQRDSDNYLAKAIDLGVNYVDIAPSYGNAEVILGQSLKPYRKDIYLACKTQERTAKEAEAEFHRSLKHLHTDWFDVYQLHAMTTPEDVKQAFGPGGTMDLVLKLKQEGLVRKIGFSAHDERAALEALKLYDFDTVMFPVNWLLNLGQGIGNELFKLKAEKGFGLLAIKAIVERAWKQEGEREASPWPKSWCKPFDANDRDARLAGMRFSLNQGADALIPPGNWECQSFMMANIDEVQARPYGPEDEALLQSRLKENKAHPFFDKNAGGWPE